MQLGVKTESMNDLQSMTHHLCNFRPLSEDGTASVLEGQNGFSLGGRERLQVQLHDRHVAALGTPMKQARPAFVVVLQ